MAIPTALAYYKLDESSGNAADATGNGYTLTNTGTVTFSTGLINNGSYNTTSSQYLGRSSAFGLTSSSNFSISLWIKLTSDNTADRDIFNFDVTGASGSTIRGVYEYNSGTRRLRFYRASNTNTFLDINGNIGTNAWYHLVFTYNGGTGAMALYKNNAAAVTGTNSGTTNNANSSQFNIMSTVQYSFNAPLNGGMDEVGIWNAVLTSGEVSELYNGGAGLAYPFTGSFTPTPEMHMLHMAAGTV